MTDRPRLSATFVFGFLVAAAVVAVIVFYSSSLERVLAQTLLKRGYVSAELGMQGFAGTPEQATATWIHRNRDLIVHFSRYYRVSPYAVAGVIAYEALDNTAPAIYEASGIARYDGPGKVHFRQYRFAEGDPPSKEVEDMGYLPAQTETGRAALLSKPMGAVVYISAIMDAFANAGYHHGYSIRCRPDILVSLYSAWTVREFERHTTDSLHHELIDNDAGLWVASHRKEIASMLGKQHACAFGRMAFYIPSRPRIASPALHHS